MLNSKQNNLPESNTENSENRKNHEQNFTGKKRMIEKRKEQVFLLNSQGYSNQEIAEKLGVSLSTIEKDVHESKFLSVKLYRRLIDTGMLECYAESYFQLQAVRKELWIKYRTGRVEERMNALNQLKDLILKMCSLFGIPPSKITSAMMQKAAIKSMIFEDELDNESKSN